jgi:hypothetical protein
VAAAPYGDVRDRYGDIWLLHSTPQAVDPGRSLHGGFRVWDAGYRDNGLHVLLRLVQATVE